MLKTCGACRSLSHTGRTMRTYCSIRNGGLSFAPLLDNPDLQWKRAAFSQVKRSMGRSVCTERYRYNSWGTTGEELYDHNEIRMNIPISRESSICTVLNEMRTILAEGWTKSIPPPQCPNPQTFYADNDGDGYGNPSISVKACSVNGSFIADNTDCNDGNAKFIRRSGSLW